MVKHPELDLAAVIGSASDALHVRRAFGEAYERDGHTVIPVARILGGSGSGSGGGGSVTDEAPPGTENGGYGIGGGFGVQVRPIGVYVIDATGVHWRPAVDVNRIVRGGQVTGALLGVSLMTLLTVRSLRRRRPRQR